MWIAQAFNMVDLVARGERLDLGFISLRDGTPLWIVRTRENGGKVSIRCDNMATAAEVMQDLCRFLNIKELESVAEFPEEMKKFQDVFNVFPLAAVVDEKIF